MSKLYACGVCCFILSIWGTIQLIIMGVLYKIESATLLEDVAPQEFTDPDPNDLVNTIRENYAAVSRNCFIAGGIYFVLIFLSLICIYRARAIAKKNVKRDDLDDDIFCDPQLPGSPPKKMKAKVSSSTKKAKESTSTKKV